MYILITIIILLGIMLVYKQIMWKVTLCAKISRLEEWLWEKSLLYATFDNLLEEWLSGSVYFYRQTYKFAKRMTERNYFYRQIYELARKITQWEVTFIGKIINLL